MSGRLKLGFVPLNDAAVLIAAADKGFFAAEGLDVELSREASWATVRDKLAVGALDGAHMLAPMTLAATLGAGSDPTPMVAPLALNMNGPVVTLSPRLAELVGPDADAGGLSDLLAGRRADGAGPPTFAVVFPFSSHNYLLRGWLAEAGVDPDRDVRLAVVPPQRMAELLAAGAIEGFCAGEPWSAAAVALGAGQVVARAAQLRAATPDKVFGVTQAWSARRPADLQALLRGLIRAASWAEAAESQAEVTGLLAQRLGVAETLVSEGRRAVVVPRDGAAAPRQADAVWLLDQMARWGQIAAGVDHAAVASRVYRPDLHAEAAQALPA